MRRSKWRKREFLMNQVDFQQGLFSLLVYFIAHLSSPKLCFFSSCPQHQKHYISVIFNITPNMIFRKMGVLASA